MGNTNSTTNNPPQQGSRRPGDKPSPSPNKTTDPSLRQKKRSLELPDLTPASTNYSSRGRQSQQSTAARPIGVNANPTKSANIPIPRGPDHNALNIPGEAGRIRAPITLPSEVDVTTLREQQRDEYSTHRPFPPNRDHVRDGDRDRERDRDSRGRHGHGSRKHRDKDRDSYKHREREDQYRNEQRIQNYYYQSESQAAAAAQATPRQTAFVPQIVHSSIPILLGRRTEDSEGLLPPSDSDGQYELRDMKITWRGGGKAVFLARAGDDDWKGRLEMIPESPGSSVFHATVSLAPGTHHIRFLIDDQWRVADDYPTAVDDQGSLANYVAVPIHYSSAPIATTTNTLAQSSTSPITSPTNTIKPSPPQINLPPHPLQQLPRRLQPGQSFWSAASSNDDGTDEADTHTHSPHAERLTAQQRAAAAAAAIQKENWTSVIPAELIEAARLEEEYLDATSNPDGYHQHSHGGRMQTHTSGFIPVPQIPQPPALPRHLDKLILNTRGLTAGGAGHQNSSTSLGSAAGRGDPMGSSSGRSRGERSTSVGAGQGSTGREKRSGRADREGRDEGRERDRAGRERRGRDRERQWPVAPPPSEADTSIEVTAPSEDSKPVSGGGVSNSESTESNASGSSTSTAGTTATTSTVTPEGSAPPTPVIPSSSSAPTSRPLILGPDQPTSTVGGKTIANVPNPTLTDDGSVLPVPSHAVLQHLSTSSIRNGVLAVASTTRYKSKYLTSIYYKPI